MTEIQPKLPLGSFPGDASSLLQTATVQTATGHISRISSQFQKPFKMPRNRWHYPNDIAHDLDHLALPTDVKGEILACAWEYSRCVIPEYTNWNRYVAFMRIIIIGIIAEFRGEMVNVATDHHDLLGYDLDKVLHDLFHDTPGHEEMAREYKTFLLVTSHKASEKRHHSELFRRYVNALAASPQQWFRMRDCDALARFTIASALACNDLLDVWYTEQQWDVLCEIGDTMYDAVAFFKHRAEGETNNTFAYVPEDERNFAFHQARELLWALDVSMAGMPGHTVLVNFLRAFGGPIHMMMRRYRFVEEELTIGRPEDDHVLAQVRMNKKLWNRVDADQQRPVYAVDEYLSLLPRSGDLMFDGLVDSLQRADEGCCKDCHYKTSYGARKTHAFGGVELCEQCREGWRHYIRKLPERTMKAFPVIGPSL